VRPWSRKTSGRPRGGGVVRISVGWPAGRRASDGGLTGVRVATSTAACSARGRDVGVGQKFCSSPGRRIHLPFSSC
jgi:hypothetical protein